MKTKRRSSLRRVRTSSKTKMKSRILLSSKMTIKILSVFARSVNMMKKYKNTQSVKVTSKSKEIKSIPK